MINECQNKPLRTAKPKEYQIQNLPWGGGENRNRKPNERKTTNDDIMKIQ